MLYVSGEEKQKGGGEMKYIIALEVVNGTPTQFCATWRGDPGRTCCDISAKRFNTISLATYELARARRYRPFLNAQILKVEK